MFFLKIVKNFKNIDFFKKDKQINLIDELNIKKLVFSTNNFFIKNYINKNMNFKEDYLRLKAEMENNKKRFNDDVNKTYKYAIEEFSENLLNVMDSLEAALYNKSNEIEKLLEGIKLILQMMNNILKKNNIYVINPSKGDQFNPYKHLAISKIKVNEIDGSIISILQKGYSIFDRLLRPALVVVNKV